MTTDHTRDALATATAQNAGIVHALLAIADAIDGGPYVPDAIRETTPPPRVDPEIDEDDVPAPEPCAADGCVLRAGHVGEHSADGLPTMTTVRGGPRYHHLMHTDGTVTPFAAITVDEPKPEFCTSNTRSDPTPDGKQALVSCNRIANHAGLHMDGSWVWAGEPGHEYALTNLDSGGDAVSCALLAAVMFALTAGLTS